MDVKIKYLKNQKNEIFSPVANMNTVFDDEGNSLNEQVNTITSLLDTINGEEV